MTSTVPKSAESRKGSGPRYSIIPAAFVLDCRPGIWHFRVINLLGRHTDKHGWCVRSQSEMAKDIATTRETVNRTIRDLCEWGYVQKTDQGENKKSVCYYRVVMDPPEPPEAVEIACDAGVTCDQPITGGCDDSDHRGVTPAITGGVITAITPITTPLKRPKKNDQEASERASDDDARAPAPVKRPTPSITVKSGEAAFAAWIDHLRATGRSGLADDARDAGVMTVPKRWPSGDDHPLAIPKPARSGLSDVSMRMAGETGK